MCLLLCLAFFSSYDSTFDPDFFLLLLLTNNEAQQNKRATVELRLGYSLPGTGTDTNGEQIKSGHDSVLGLVLGLAILAGSLLRHHGVGDRCGQRGIKTPCRGGKV